jgi:hypothetical protein
MARCIYGLPSCHYDDVDIEKPNFLGLRSFGCGKEVMTCEAMLWHDQPSTPSKSRHLKHIGILVQGS